MKKYEFTGEKKGKLKRIRAIRDFSGVMAGAVGGWIEKEENLSHFGSAWVSGDVRVFGDAKVYDDAKVYGDAQVSGDARVFGSARVFGDAQVSGDARVFGDAQVSGDARVFGDVRVFGDAQVSGDARVYGDARVFGDARVYGVMRSDGYCFCYVPDAEGIFHVIAGCRYFTMDEARAHWQKTRRGTPLGDETTAILDVLEALHKVKPEGCV